MNTFQNCNSFDFLPLSNSIRLLVLLIAGCFVGCGGVQGPPRYALEGEVRIGGDAAERVIVQLNLEGSEAAKVGNDRYPSALTDEKGKFSIGKNSSSLGVIEGEYVVTFSWLSGPELSATDRLKGAFADPGKSKYRVKVPLVDPKSLMFDLPASK